MNRCACGSEISARSTVCIPCRNRTIAAGRKVIYDAEYVSGRATFDMVTGCWNWRGSRDRLGYGRVSAASGERLAHRLSYRVHNGPIGGETIDHTCYNTSCVNPEHLRVLSRVENARQSRASIARAAKTHCPQGHPYAGENLLPSYRERPGRRCRACLRVAVRKSDAKRKAARLNPA